MVKSKMKKILVTGATGQIGSELVLSLRKRYGEESVIAVGHKRSPSSQLLNSGPFYYIDVTDRNQIIKFVEKFEVDIIFHLSSILSVVGEVNPSVAWQVNMNGLYNVLEVAREYKLSKVFWPSSIAVFGPETPRIKTPQKTVLIPRTMYGLTKVAGELLCNYYFTRFNLDVRSVRYPGIISSETPPGGGTTDYAVEIFYEAIRNQRYTCFVREDTILPMMYMPDCIDAAINIMEIDSSKVKCHTSYNLASMSFSVGELADEIRIHFPKFKCEYKPDSRQKIADSWPVSIDDTLARKDWGWNPNYNIRSMVKDMLEKLSKRFAEGNL